MSDAEFTFMSDGMRSEVTELLVRQHRICDDLMVKYGINIPVKPFSMWVSEASVLSEKAPVPERALLALLRFYEYVYFRVWEKSAGKAAHEAYFNRRNVLAGKDINNIKDKYLGYVVYTINSIYQFQQKAQLKSKSVLCPDVWRGDDLYIEKELVKCLNELNKIDGISDDFK